MFLAYLNRLRYLWKRCVYPFSFGLNKLLRQKSLRGYTTYSSKRNFQLDPQNNKDIVINQKPHMPSVYGNVTSLMLRQALTIWQNDSASELHRASAALNDDEWFEVPYDSVEGKLFDGHMLPGFIEEETRYIYFTKQTS